MAPSEKKFRIGVIGFGHMHINDIMRRFNEVPNIQWVAGADTIPDVPETKAATFTRAWNVKYAHDEAGIPKIYADYHEMLNKEKFDVVAVYSENAQHGEICEAIAAHHFNILVEKPMASSLFEAIRMVRAARNAGVKLIINWPSTWLPTTTALKHLIQDGIIGQPYQLKYRAAHNGPLGAGASHQGVAATADTLTDADRSRAWWYRANTGGGALLDFCSYGACMSRWYFDAPAIAAFGMAANLGSPFASAEDNAVISVRFPKSIALLEASWTTLDNGVNTGPIVYGEKGTLIVEEKDGKSMIKVLRGHGAEPEWIEPAALPVGRQSVAQEYVHWLTTGDPVHPTLEPEFNLEAMAILDAGKRSAASGKLELVNDLRWCLG